MGLSKIFISCIFCYFFIITKILSESIEEDPDEYFGVPLGALHYSAAGTSAEVYAADEYTIVFNHFTHRPQKLGCTSMMIGPPRSEDTEDVIPGHGVLIGIAQPLMSMRSRRAKRQFGLWKSNINLPRQFDHLFMEPTNGTAKTAVNEKKAFSGIHIQHENKETKDITIAPQTTPTTTVSTTTSTSTTPKTTTSTQSTTTSSATRAARITKKPTLQVPSRPLILFNNKAPSAAPKASRTPLSRWSSSGSSESQEGPGIMLMSEEEHFYRKPNNVHPSFLGPLPRDVVTEIKITTTTSQPIVNRLRMVSAEEFPRRAPARRTFENNKFVDEWEITTTEQPSTPLFWVIADPHEKRRRERLEQLRKQGKQTPKFTTTTRRPSMDIKFALPSINDRAAAFTLTNGAKITDYLWIGLYDQCEHKSVPLISLKNIDPPREERINPLSGWSHNVTSYRVQILNCNTIIIPGFIYNGQNATANTYIYVGIGHFPDQIEKQEKATVVGQKREDPLRSYDREDVLIRLPNGYRTFDIDFISIYNTDEEKSYGHVIIPSLLVPPCADD